MIAWTLFYNPIELPWDVQLWLLLPLCAGVALVYKAVRVHDIRRLWREVAVLWAYMLGGLTALAAALWVVSAALT